MQRAAVACGLGTLVLSACWGSYSPVPLQGGETMTFAFGEANGNSVGTLTFEKVGSGYTIKASAPMYAPQRVGPDLMAGRRPIRAFDLGMLWLPPELRAVGKQTFLGDVRELKKRDSRDVYVVWTRDGVEKRYFDKDSGFLVFAKISASSHAKSALLTLTTIPGVL